MSSTLVAAVAERAVHVAIMSISNQPQPIVELHGLSASAALNGKRGRLCGFNPSRGRAAVALTFVRERMVTIQQKWVLPTNLCVVSPLSDTTPLSHGSLLPSTSDSAAMDCARVCHLDCCIADFCFSHRLDSVTNAGWWRLPFEDFMAHLFAQVMTQGLGLAAEDSSRPKLFCGRLRLDGWNLSWPSVMGCPAGDVLHLGAAPDEPHRLELHLDFVVPRGPRTPTTPAKPTAGAARVCVADAGVRGMGLVAKHDTAAGDLLAFEAPLARLPLRYTMDELRRCVGALDAQQQRRFFDLAHHAPKYGELKDVHGVWQTNALPLSTGCGDGEPYPGAASSDAVVAGHEAGVCALLARANHSCAPNARYEWDAVAGMMRLIALDDIAAGAEVTISYGAPFSIDRRASVEMRVTRAERRRRLHERFGFDCDCVACHAQGDGRAPAATALDEAAGGRADSAAGADSDSGSEARVLE